MRLLGVFAALLTTAALSAPALAKSPSFSLPLRCQAGETCFIQHYPGWPTKTGTSDYRCGKQTTEGRSGTSFRLQDVHMMQKGVPALAAADGLVVGVRDGMDDAILMPPERIEAVKGNECGNAVILAHGHGWRSQYCHLREGSISVKAGQEVRRGQKLGLVGSSGGSLFPQLDFRAYYGTTVIDPFAGRAPGGRCGTKLRPLWTKSAAKALRYRRGSVLAVGFAAEPMNSLKAAAPGPKPDSKSPVIVAYGNLLNLEAGDRVRITLDGPPGRLADNELHIREHQSQRLVFNGVRRKKKPWPAGEYVAAVQVFRGGKLVLIRTSDMTIAAK